MKKIYASIFALAMTFAANAEIIEKDFVGTYKNCNVSVDYVGNIGIFEKNPVVVQSNVILAKDTDNEGFFKLAINEFTFLTNNLNIAVNKLSASEITDGVSLSSAETYLVGPNAVVQEGLPEVSTILKINNCKVVNKVLSVELVVYINGTIPFNLEQWLTDIGGFQNEDEAYEESALVKVGVSSLSAENFTPESGDGIFTPNAESLNIAIAEENILVNDAEGETFAIYNALGSKIAEGKVFNNQINIANLASGVYAVVVGNASATFAK